MDEKQELLNLLSNYRFSYRMMMDMSDLGYTESEKYWYEQYKEVEQLILELFEQKDQTNG